MQVFDLQLAGQLVELGHDVTLPAECTWRERFERHWGEVSSRGGEGGGGGAVARPRIVYTPRLFAPLWNGLWAALTLERAKYDVCYLGNNVRGIVPAIDVMRRRGLFERMVIQANRTPREPFNRAMRRWKGARVVAVSELVARGFPGDLRERVDVHYGIANAEAFGAKDHAARAPGPVRFCVMGALDNEWKGAGLAIEAMRLLRARGGGPPIELHLCAYKQRPVLDDERIVIHEWMAAERVPTFLDSMDVMLVPSTDNETFSQVMVQGMLSGLPIVSYDLPVLTEKLDAGGGLVFRTSGELAEHMARLAGDGVLRAELGRQARATALERYVWETGRFVERYLLAS